MRLFLFFFLHLLIFLILIITSLNAEEKLFTCKPTLAGVQLDNGIFFENDYDEKTPLIDKLTTTQFILREQNIFYKNNQNRIFEQLIPYKSF